jgi:hypothetical protein
MKEGKMKITEDIVDVSIRVTPETGTLHINVRERHVDAVRKALPFPTGPEDWLPDGPGWRLLIADLSRGDPNGLVQLAHDMAIDLISATKLRVLGSRTKQQHVAAEMAELAEYDARGAPRSPVRSFS